MRGAQLIQILTINHSVVTQSIESLRLIRKKNQKGKTNHMMEMILNLGNPSARTMTKKKNRNFKLITIVNLLRKIKEISSAITPRTISKFPIQPRPQITSELR